MVDLEGTPMVDMAVMVDLGATTMVDMVDMATTINSDIGSTHNIVRPNLLVNLGMLNVKPSSHIQESQLIKANEPY